MHHLNAHAKLNLGLVVGPLRPDGKHEVVTILQRIGLHDDVSLELAPDIEVEGYADDTIVRAALRALADAAGPGTGWSVRIEKRIPVAAGLGGGSTDAAAALQLANSTLRAPLVPEALHSVAVTIGADVPFFLREGPQLATGDGTDLESVLLPSNYTVLLVVPEGAPKESTRSVYDAFDHRGGPDGYEERAARFTDVLAAISSVDGLAGLPANDLATSPLAAELVALGAFRADVSGAGRTVYGLFRDAATAAAAEQALRFAGRTILTQPV